MKRPCGKAKGARFSEAKVPELQGLMKQVGGLNGFQRNSSNLLQELGNMNTSQQNKSDNVSPIQLNAHNKSPMKKLLISVLMVSLATILLGGCAWQVGGDKKVTTMEPTTGQQLIDLQKAKDSGAITDQAQKAKLLGGK
jgi:cytoskeletal protein RodZ